MTISDKTLKHWRNDALTLLKIAGYSYQGNRNEILTDTINSQKRIIKLTEELINQKLLKLRKLAEKMDMAKGLKMEKIQNKT